MPECVRAALSYASFGFPVIPLHVPLPGGGCSCGDLACRSPGKHPRTTHGLKDASVDASVIRDWWTRWPNANVGIATGGASRLLVLDVDPRNGGLESFAELTRVHGELHDSVCAKTGGGGFHVYFSVPDNGMPIRSRSGIAPGIDFKGDGGYVVAPPSLHVSGRAYEWEKDPNSTALASPPTWLLDLLNPVAKPSRPTVSSMVNGTRYLEGERNQKLASLAGTMRARGMLQSAIEAALLEVNREQCSPPLDEDEVGRIAASIAGYPPNDPMVAAPLTDLGNAERLVAREGDSLLYVPEWKRWLVWDGSRHAPDVQGRIVQAAKRTVREIPVAARSVADDELRKALLKHATRSESHARVRAMIEFGASDPAIVVSSQQLDAHPKLLNVENGTIDLRTGKLLPHSRDNLITKLAPVRFDPSARCPLWLNFLCRIMDGREDLVSFLQRAIGYSLTGLTIEQVLFLCYGEGANGKTTLLELLRKLMGEYAQQADFSSFLEQQSDRIRNDIARLKGARFVSAVEADAQRALSESVLKQVTGGDTITARFLRAEFFEFRPTAKLWLAANHRPEVRGSDHAIWRRICLIPFDVRIPESERDRELPSKLEAELPGILNWAVAGALQWFRGGLDFPPEVRASTSDYRKDMDIIGTFMDDCCEIHPSHTVEIGRLYRRYAHWCESAKESVLSKRAFGRELDLRGFSPRKGSKGVRVRTGLRLLSSPTVDQGIDLPF